VGCRDVDPGFDNGGTNQHVETLMMENIQKAAERLAELVPEARIAIGHGQMRERELERVMNDFHHQRFNVLVCTTIIETG
ncbi:helicase-related protein, partial [Escherichia sp. R-CC3]